MNDHSQHEILQDMIAKADGISDMERLYYAQELESVSDLNGEDGRIGRAVKSGTYSAIVFRLGETNRINRAIREHSTMCKFKNAFGSISTKWGNVSGEACIILIVVAGLVAWHIGPAVAQSIWGHSQVEKVEAVSK